MKYALLFFSFFIVSASIAQQTVGQLVKEGIEYHDKGNYENAIKLYQQALQLDENSALANYEIALSYMYDKQYKNSLKHSDRVIEINGQYLLPAYTTKGSCLDALGKSQEAVETYNKALRELGSNYLLYYNLGLTYYKSNKLEKAQEAATNAILQKKNHSSSHLLLGFIMNDEDNKVQSLLSLYYFLLLEPNSGKSARALGLLKTQFSGNIKRNGPKDISIILDSQSMDKKNKFSAAEMMISMLAASNTLEENKGKTEEELFAENTESFFKVLGELKKKKNKGLYWEFYVPFFYEIAKTKHIEAYSYYISQSGNDLAVDWLRENKTKVEKLSDWLQER